MLKTMRVVFVTLLLTLVVSGVTSAQTERRQVWAYYFGWWGQESWNDGRLVDKPAQLYSSFDAGAVGRQIDEAKGAGIDAFRHELVRPQEQQHDAYGVQLPARPGSGTGFQGSGLG